MADYAEGPFERVVNVGWGSSTPIASLFWYTGFNVPTVQFSNGVLQYRTCNGTLTSLNYTGFYTRVVGDLINGPASAPDFSEATLSLRLETFTQSMPGSGDTLDIAWTGYGCPPPGPAVVGTPVVGTASGQVGVSVVSSSLLLALIGYTGTSPSGIVGEMQLYMVGDTTAAFTNQFFDMFLG